MSRLRRVAAILFFALVVRPVLMIATGLRVIGRERLPLSGPAVVAANHNSHLDVVALMSLFPLRLLHRVRPVAAADHFLKPGFVGWMARTLLNIIPIDRSGCGADAAIAPVCQALHANAIVIMFPEGTRGEPEVMARFRRGTSLLAKAFRDTPFVPVYLHGLGKSLPRGEWRFVPFAAEVHIGRSRSDATGTGRPMAEQLQDDVVAIAARLPRAGFVD
ncbi:lysophospholipid acyltransferase family protein [Bauldia sp.]|uniref:lysophospholipid acyltransferase family protein n=1 Tax=Bauldia sp. TaxID=2575872 RepID=UPI003BA8722A